MAAARAIFEEMWLTISKFGLQKMDCEATGNSHDAATQTDFMYLLESGSSPHSLRVAQELTPSRLIRLRG